MHSLNHTTVESRSNEMAEKDKQIEAAILNYAYSNVNEKQQGVVADSTHAISLADNGVQCQLLVAQSDPHDGGPLHFDIGDRERRRCLVRKIFLLIIAQNLVAAFAMAALLHCYQRPLSLLVNSCVNVMVMCIYLLLFLLTDRRRRAPQNYVALVLVTAFDACGKATYAAMLNFLETALLVPATIIVALLLLMAYTTIGCCRITNWRGVLLACLVGFGVLGCSAFFWPSHLAPPSCALAAISVAYALYDTQLQLSGHYGYQLKANEHVFAVTNIYANLPVMLWRLIYHMFLEEIIQTIKFFWRCCRRDVC